MNLNEIFRRFGEPVYNTPVAVVAELAGQNTGGAEFANPPYELAEAGCETIHDQQPAPCSAIRGERDGNGLSDYLESISISVIVG
jgi:hypothetical protein